MDVNAVFRRIDRFQFNFNDRIVIPQYPSNADVN